MKSLTTYEIAIAEKVAQLPVPDLADQIWATIELQLDLDTPSGNDETGGNQPAPSPSAPAPVQVPYLIILATVAAAVLIFFLYRAMRKDAPAPATPPTPVPAQISPPGSDPSVVDSNNTITIPNKINSGSPRVPVKDSPGSTLANPKDIIIPLNSDRQVVPLAVPDSLRKQTVGQLTQPLLSADSVSLRKPTPNRPRGVSNISDSNYKIVHSKKDSGRGN